MKFYMNKKRAGSLIAETKNYDKPHCTESKASVVKLMAIVQFTTSPGSQNI